MQNASSRTYKSGSNRLRLASTLLFFLLLVLLAAPAAAQDTKVDSPASPNAAPSQVTAVVVPCGSKPGERTQCAADTSAGVVLLRSTGAAPCLLGRTWGYDPGSVWVSDGCTAEFGTGAVVAPETTNPKPLSHVPNVGFLLFTGDEGEIYFRLFTYGRYLNQRNLDPTYVDAFGNTKTIQRRQDIQLQKFFAPFSGWFLTPKMRYYLYVWSSNASQGDPAQVVGAGNITWNFNRFVSVGVGRVRRRVPDRTARTDGGGGDHERPQARAQHRLPDLRRREGADLHAPLHLRAVSEPAQPR